MRKAKAILLSKKGDSYILTCAILMLLCVIMSVLMNFLATTSMAQAQRKNTEQILDRYVQVNSIWIHDHIKNEKDITSSLETAQYITMLKGQQQLTENQPNTYTAYAKPGVVKYYITDIEMHYIAGEIAHIRVTYNLHYPFVFLGHTFWITSPAEVQSRYNPKFGIGS